MLTPCIQAQGADPGTQVDLPSCPASFIMDTAVDASGTVWVASEAQGVWRLPPGGTWQNMNETPGFPQDSLNTCALAVDAQGRVWVGTAHEGVAVWNGESWKTYNRLNGLSGDHVFDIQVDPSKGDVAVSTSGGLSLYDGRKGSWKTVSRAEGLTENQIEAMTFTPGGALVAAYQCGGLGTSSPQSGWTKWNNVQAPWYWDEKQLMYQPGERYGMGLPSNLCNAVAAAGETIWVGTQAGLAYLYKGKWLYTRGKDAEAKTKGIFGGEPLGYRKTGFPSELPKPDLLPEDYVTALFPCREGLWVGFRKEGAVLLDVSTMSIKERALGKQRNERAKWVTGFVALPNGDIYAGTNGGGLQKVGRTTGRREIKAPGKPSVHPREALSPLVPQKTEVTGKVTGAKPGVIFAGEDWTTRGDWCGHYGQDHALLCAVNAPYSHTCYSTRYPDWCKPGTAPAGEKILETDVRGYIGPHKGEKDFLRAWCHRASWPDNRNVLYCPEVGTRTEAEWDDHGEAYASTFDGPDIWIAADIPEGLHEVALYFYNPNGRESINGYRDYLVEARTWKSKYPGYVNFLIQGNRLRSQTKKEMSPGAWQKNLEKRKEDLFARQQAPVAARTRVRNFAGNGVYKRFLVQGPVTCSFTIKRNASFNTILNGVFTTRLDDKYETLSILAPKDEYIPLVEGITVGDDLPMNILSLWAASACQALPSPAQWDQGERTRLSAYRALKTYLASHEGNKLLHSLMRVWQFKLRIWDLPLREAFDEACNRSWQNLQKNSTIYRSKEWRPNSPNVLPLSREELSEMQKRDIDWQEYLPGSQTRPKMNLEELKRFLKEAPPLNEEQDEDEEE